MTVAPGERFGPYEIVSALGAGGMGEVYRARDDRLKRDVAIKVLPAAFSTDPDRLRRFELEALSASALNHPNILTIHDVGTREGIPYVVSELLEGETLRERLRDGALPLRRTTDYALQVARGLAAAHEKGFVHRDLKPENLFVTRDGRVKILDFGLAKLTTPESPGGSATGGPTLATEPGAILGTAGYMSPEQVRGESADHRSDIFAFGAVLYEMLTGERAFRGGSSLEILSAILRDEPPEVADVRKTVPLPLSRVTRHCLEKSPHERFQSIRDVAFDLETMSGLSATTTPAPTPAARRRMFPVFPALAGGLALLALGYVLGVLRRPDVPAPPVVNVHRLTDFEGLEEFPAISPDGKSVAFAASVGDVRQIWVRLVSGGTPLQLTRDDADHQFPRWAPDGTSIVYFSPATETDTQGTLWEIAALGGEPRRVANSVGGADVSPDGKKIAFFASQKGGIELVVASRDGGDPRTVARFPLGSYYLSPRWSPDGSSIAYQRGYVFNHDVYVVAASGGEPRAVTHDSKLLSGLTWTRDGAAIVYSSARNSTVLYLPSFNLWRARLDGGELRQLTFGEASYSDPDLGASGELVATRTFHHFDVWKFPVDGSPADNARSGTRVTRQTGQVQTPSIGRSDREFVYLSDSGGHGNLWIGQTDTGAGRQITYERDPSIAVGVPVWSPDGGPIAFVSTRNHPGGVGVWLVQPDGSNLRNIVPEGGWATWSGDGRWLYFNEGPVGGGNLRKVRVEGGAPVTLRTDGGNRSAVAPDGSALYYVLERPTVYGSSDYEILAARPETGPSRVLARIPARRIPQWQLVHPVVSPDGRFLALPLTDGATTNVWTISTSGGPMRQLTDFGRRPTFIARRVTWSTDGRFILAAVGDGDADVVKLEGLR